MTPAQKSAHERLLSVLPVRTHEFKDEIFTPGKHAKAKRPVIVNGRTYPSINAAAKATGFSRQCIHFWVKSGDERARYAE